MNLASTLSRGLFIIAGATVIYVSVLPASSLVETGVWDKAEHAGAYALLTVLGAAAYRGPRYRPWLALGLVALGLGLECIQTQVPGRSGELADGVANSIGVMLGQASYLLGFTRTSDD